MAQLRAADSNDEKVEGEITGAKGQAADSKHKKVEGEIEGEKEIAGTGAKDGPRAT